MTFPRYPPVSRPASDFGPPQPSSNRTVPENVLTDALELVCQRPIHHVLEFAALHRRLERLVQVFPGVERRLWLHSALEDGMPFASLPVDRIERLPRGGCPLERFHTLPDPEYHEGVPESRERRAASDTFFTAVATASPRWLTAANAEPSVALPERPSFLLHQARFHLGDTLWITPLLRALRRLFPGSRTTLVGPPIARQALARNPHLDALIVYDPNAGPEERQRVRDAVIEDHRKVPFDAALFALVHQPESFWLAETVAEIGVPQRVNLEYFDRADDGVRIAAPFTHEGWFFWGTMPSPRLLLHALDPFSAGTAHSEEHHPEERRVLFPVGPEDRVAANGWHLANKLGDAFAVLTPGGKSSERWPPLCFAKLAGALTEEYGWDVVLEGAPNEKALLNEIVAAARPAKGRQILAATHPLTTMAALLERARLLVSNDSAPIHLAESVNAPTLYLAHHEKIVHSHPTGGVCWALYDDAENRVSRISTAQVLGALAQNFQ